MNLIVEFDEGYKRQNPRKNQTRIVVIIHRVIVIQTKFRRCNVCLKKRERKWVYPSFWLSRCLPAYSAEVYYIVLFQVRYILKLQFIMVKDRVEKSGQSITLKMKNPQALFITCNNDVWLCSGGSHLTLGEKLANKRKQQDSSSLLHPNLVMMLLCDTDN